MGTLLARQHFTLITDQKSVAFMLDNRKRRKIHCRRLELASFSYIIKFRPGRDNVAADAFTVRFALRLTRLLHKNCTKTCVILLLEG